MTTIGALDAASAYRRVIGLGNQAPPAAGGAGQAKSDTGFGDLVEGMIADTAGQLRAAESASIRQVAGKGDLIDVVTAIGSAETALDTMVAVRDRVVSAYADIMRMQI